MSMALAATRATALMVGIVSTMAMVPNCLFGMMVVMVQRSKHEVDSLAMAMGLMVVVSKVEDFHAMDLDLQQMAEIAIMSTHQRIGQPPNSVVIGLEQGHARTICCGR